MPFSPRHSGFPASLETLVLGLCNAVLGLATSIIGRVAALLPVRVSTTADGSRQLSQPKNGQHDPSSRYLTALPVPARLGHASSAASDRGQYFRDWRPKVRARLGCTMVLESGRAGQGRAKQLSSFPSPCKPLEARGSLFGGRQAGQVSCRVKRGEPAPVPGLTWVLTRADILGRSAPSRSRGLSASHPQ